MPNKLPSFVRLPAYYRFDYKPRYYDPRKETAGERKEKRIHFKRGGHQEYSSHISGKLRRGSITYSKHRTERQNSGIRSLLILGMLFLIAAYYLDMISGAVTIGMLIIFFVILIQKTQKL